jgi:hypothetical protein
MISPVMSTAAAGPGAFYQLPCFPPNHQSKPIVAVFGDRISVSGLLVKKKG